MTTTTIETVIGARAMVTVTDLSQLPASRRSGEPFLAVRRASTSGWVGFWPNPAEEDFGSNYGWRLTANLSRSEIEAMRVTDLIETHRGWHIGTPATIEPIAASTSPSDLGPRTAAQRITELEAEVERLKREHETFVVRASDILGAEADSHDLCEVYDGIAERAGLRRRERTHEVTLTVTYKQTVNVRAYDEDLAVEKVQGLTTQQAWRYVAGNPFTDNDHVVDFGGVYELKVEVD